MKEPLRGIGAAGYREVGLLANPFRVSRYSEGLNDTANVVCHAEHVRLLRAIDAEADTAKARPVWVTKAEDIPDYYSRVAVASLLSLVPENDDLNVLVAYVPFFLMRTGRIRSALAMVAERLSGESFGRTLGAYAADAFGEPDVPLLEESGLSADEASELAQRFSEDPAGTAEVYFGGDAGIREAGPTPQQITQSAALRHWNLDGDPEAIEEQSDDSIELGATGVFANLKRANAENTIEEEPSEGLDDTVTDQPVRSPVCVYLIEHVRSHISPVMARGLTAYLDEGIFSLCEELKITRGPRRTLAALASFATHRFRKVVIVYDQFEAWANAPQDLRIKIAGSLAEIRMLLAETGVVVILADEHGLEDIKGQFLGSNEVEWSMAPLLEEVDETLGLPASLAKFCFDAATIDSKAAGPMWDSVQSGATGMGDDLLDSYGQVIDDAIAVVDR